MTAHNEHPNRPGHFIALVEDTGKVRCTHPSHTLVADANVCGFYAVWAGATTRVTDVEQAHQQALWVELGRRMAERVGAPFRPGDIVRNKQAAEHANAQADAAHERMVDLAVGQDPHTSAWSYYG